MRAVFLGALLGLTVVRASAKAAGNAVPSPDNGRVQPPPLALERGKDLNEAGSNEAPPPPPPPRRRAVKPGASLATSTESMPTAPPGAGQSPTAFAHDGFYLRFGLGGTYGRTQVRTDLVSQPDVRITGFGSAIDLWAGWTVSTGLVLGPALSLASQRSQEAAVGSGPPFPATATQALLGAFLDAYPNPRQGAHFGGLLALAALQESTDDDNPQTSFEGGGVGFQVFAGFDAWLAREWCVGGLLRLGGIVTQARQTLLDQSVNKQGTAYGLSLLATVLHH